MCNSALSSLTALCICYFRHCQIDQHKKENHSDTGIWSDFFIDTKLNVYYAKQTKQNKGEMLYSMPSDSCYVN